MAIVIEAAYRRHHPTRHRHASTDGTLPGVDDLDEVSDSTAGSFGFGRFWTSRS
jgi:hypothetical protein